MRSELKEILLTEEEYIISDITIMLLWISPYIGP